MLFAYNKGMSKNSLRTQYITVRKTVDGSQDMTRQLAKISLLSPTYAHVYYSNKMLNEVGTEKIIDWLMKRWPAIRIIQPKQDKLAPMYSNHLDVIFVPVVAFDVRGNRIGMGGGWYDKFLAMHPESIKIGLAYDECEVPKIEPEAHDIRLDYIVTPTRLIDTHKLE